MVAALQLVGSRGGTAEELEHFELLERFELNGASYLEARHNFKPLVVVCWPADHVDIVVDGSGAISGRMAVDPDGKVPPFLWMIWLPVS